MCLARMGSLNSLEGTKRAPFWTRWLQAPLPSADSVGRICSGMDPASIRHVNEQIYGRLKRNKALPAPWHGLAALALDGHESHASYRRNCDGCLQRQVETAEGKKIQYYHRNVTALLITEHMSFLLDSEPQLPGEDEVACALRLLGRVVSQYPRAFDVILGDGLYTDPRLYNFALDQGKDVLTVLKDERRDLIQDARALFKGLAPKEFSRGATSVTCWDLEGFTSWPQVKAPVRVVQSREVTKIHRQLNDQIEEVTSEWLWSTTLPTDRASSAAVVALGHARWDIENKGFNEAVSYWHADHVYKHDARAILAFWLLCMSACNLFHAFFYCNLKPALRAKMPMVMVARLLLAGLLVGVCAGPERPP
jgi:hypothetical protein